MIENCLNLTRGIKPQIEGTGVAQARKNSMKSVTRHIMIKLLKAKDKDKILKAAR